MAQTRMPQHSALILNGSAIDSNTQQTAGSNNNVLLLKLRGQTSSAASAQSYVGGAACRMRLRKGHQQTTLQLPTGPTSFRPAASVSQGPPTTLPLLPTSLQGGADDVEMLEAGSSTSTSIDSSVTSEDDDGNYTTAAGINNNGLNRLRSFHTSEAPASTNNINSLGLPPLPPNRNAVSTQVGGMGSNRSGELQRLNGRLQAESVSMGLRETGAPNGTNYASTADMSNDVDDGKNSLGVQRIDAGVSQNSRANRSQPLAPGGICGEESTGVVEEEPLYVETGVTGADCRHAKKRRVGDYSRQINNSTNNNNRGPLMPNLSSASLEAHNEMQLSQHQQLSQMSQSQPNSVTVAGDNVARQQELQNNNNRLPLSQECYVGSQTNPPRRNGDIISRTQPGPAMVVTPTLALQKNKIMAGDGASNISMSNSGAKDLNGKMLGRDPTGGCDGAMVIINPHSDNQVTGGAAHLRSGISVATTMASYSHDGSLSQDNLTLSQMTHQSSQASGFTRTTSTGLSAQQQQQQPQSHCRGQQGSRSRQKGGNVAQCQTGELEDGPPTACFTIEDDDRLQADQNKGGLDINNNQGRELGLQQGSLTRANARVGTSCRVTSLNKTSGKAMTIETSELSKGDGRQHLTEKKEEEDAEMAGPTNSLRNAAAVDSRTRSGSQNSKEGISTTSVAAGGVQIAKCPSKLPSTVGLSVSATANGLTARCEPNPNSRSSSHATTSSTSAIVASSKGGFFEALGDSGYIMTPGRHKISMNDFIMSGDAAERHKYIIANPTRAAHASYAHNAYVDWRRREKKVDAKCFQLAFEEDSSLESWRVMAIRGVFQYATTARIAAAAVHMAIVNIHQIMLHRLFVRRQTEFSDNLFASTVIAALRTAVKHEERPDKIAPFHFNSQHIWKETGVYAHLPGIDRTSEAVNKFEVENVKILDSLLCPPSSPEFLERYLTVGSWPTELACQYRELGTYFLALAAFANMSSALAEVRPSLLAAGALALAIKIINVDKQNVSYEFWPRCLEEYTDYNASDLKVVIKGVSYLLRNKPVQSHILEKIHTRWATLDWN